MKRFFALSAVAALALAGQAVAAVMGLSQVVNPPFTTDTTLTGYKGYILSVMTDDGSLISAVDVNITGNLHQRYNFNADLEDFAATPSSTNKTNGDSHLLVPATGLIGSAPAEDNNISASPVPDSASRDYGIGSFLRGAWGIPGTEQTNKAELAYIVVKDGETPNISVTANIASANGTFSLSASAFPDLGGVVELPVLTATPATGSTIDFGWVPGNTMKTLADAISLANTGPASTSINVTGVTITGADAALFSIPDFAAGTLAGGAAATKFDAKFLGTNGATNPGVKTAVATFATSLGDVSYTLTATVPEPSTIALAGLALAGVVAFGRRR